MSEFLKIKIMTITWVFLDRFFHRNLPIQRTPNQSQQFTSLPTYQSLPHSVSHVWEAVCHPLSGKLSLGSLFPLCHPTSRSSPYPPSFCYNFYTICAYLPSIPNLTTLTQDLPLSYKLPPCLSTLVKGSQFPIMCKQHPAFLFSKPHY